jgi:hypothetical protein
MRATAKTAVVATASTATMKTSTTAAVPATLCKSRLGQARHGESDDEREENSWPTRLAHVDYPQYAYILSDYLRASQDRQFLWLFYLSTHSTLLVAN